MPPLGAAPGQKLPGRPVVLAPAEPVYLAATAASSPSRRKAAPLAAGARLAERQAQLAGHLGPVLC